MPCSIVNDCEARWTLGKESIPKECSGNITLQYPDRIGVEITGGINPLMYLGEVNISDTGNVTFSANLTAIWFQNSLNIRAFPVYGNILVSGGDQSGDTSPITPDLSIEIVSGNTKATGNYPCCVCQQPLVVTPSVLIDGKVINNPNPTQIVLNKRGGIVISSFIVPKKKKDLISGNFITDPNTFVSLSFLFDYNYICRNNTALFKIKTISFGDTSSFIE